MLRTKRQALKGKRQKTNQKIDTRLCQLMSERIDRGLPMLGHFLGRCVEELFLLFKHQRGRFLFKTLSTQGLFIIIFIIALQRT